jgi:hypothetical protein
MFCVNTYAWDYSTVAALVAPRPLLICNSDKDTIFPLDGVLRIHEKVRHIYDLYGASDKLGLVITEGPHKDTQELQVPVFRWFNRFLKSDPSLIGDAAIPLFTPEQLKVLDQLPADEITSKCYEHFTRVATDAEPFDAKVAEKELRKKTFGGWPEVDQSPSAREVTSQVHDEVRLEVREFESQPGIRLRFYLARPVDGEPTAVHLETVDEENWRAQLQLARAGFPKALKDELIAAHLNTDEAVPGEAGQQFARWMRYIKENKAAYVTFTPRAVGLTALVDNQKYLVQVRRRFMLLGQTLAGMQVWDVRRAAEAVKTVPGLAELPMHFHASPEMSEVATFAAIFEPGVRSLTLAQAPRTDKEAPDFLNWSRIATPKQLLGLAEARCKVDIQPQQRSKAN